MRTNSSKRQGGAVERRHHLWREFLLTVVVIVIFSGFKFWVEHTHGGHWLHAQSHIWLRAFVSPPKADNIPVVVVDITSLKPASFHITNGTTVASELFTPRDKLLELIECIASARPTAIGIDVDLSMETNFMFEAKLNETSRQLKVRALELSQAGIPVFLGIKRNEGLVSADWLGGEAYIPLAAALARPKGIVRHMPSAFNFPGHTNPLPSLSQSLASAHFQREGNVNEMAPRVFSVIATRSSVLVPMPLAPGFSMTNFPVDYSALSSLVEQRQDWAELLRSEKGGVTNLAGLTSRFQDRMVILGDATPHTGADTAAVPGVEEPIPGVYVHACAAYTLVKAPLWELKPLVGLGLAFFASLMVSLFVYRVCYRWAGRHRVTTIPLTIVLTVVLIAGFIGIGYGLAHWLRLLWLELVVVCLVMVIHCLTEVLLGTINWSRLREGPIKSLVVSSKPKR